MFMKIKDGKGGEWQVDTCNADRRDISDRWSVRYDLVDRSTINAENLSEY